jgi:hypothetical protein
MKPQIPAEGILIKKDYGDAKIYEIVCECGDCNHSHTVWVEAEDIGVNVTIYTQQKTKWWELNRWQKILTLLTKGYIEVESNLIMGKQQALNYAHTLLNAVEDVEIFQKEQNE